MELALSEDQVQILDAIDTLAKPYAAVPIHDISFVAHPEWFRPREGLRRRLLTGRAAANASVIFTDSEAAPSKCTSRGVWYFNAWCTRRSL